MQRKSLTIEQMIKTIKKGYTFLPLKKPPHFILVKMKICRNIKSPPLTLARAYSKYPQEKRVYTCFLLLIFSWSFSTIQRKHYC